MNARRITQQAALGALSMALFGGALSPPEASAVEPSKRVRVWVDDDGKDCPDAEYNTVQGAVDDSLASQSLRNGLGWATVFICPGTYVENVVVPEGARVRFVGAGAGKTILSPVPGTEGPAIGAESAEFVSIYRLTVDGQSALSGPTVWGIRLQDSPARIRKVDVRNIRDEPGASQGYGISVESSATPSESSWSYVKISDSWFENITRVGIRVDGARLYAKVVHNQLVGPSAPKVWAPNGIQISRGAKASVFGNAITMATSPSPASGAGSGVILLCPGRTTVTYNEVTDSDFGVTLAETTGAWVTANTSAGSLFDAFSIQTLGTLFGDLGCPDADDGGSYVVANHAVQSGGNGIGLVSFDPEQVVPTNFHVIYNKVRDSTGTGIRVFHGADNRVLFNRIQDSGVVDAADDTTGDQTAGTANRWLANQCSSSEPAGLCI